MCWRTSWLVPYVIAAATAMPSSAASSDQRGATARAHARPPGARGPPSRRRRGGRPGARRRARHARACARSGGRGRCRRARRPARPRWKRSNTSSPRPARRPDRGRGPRDGRAPASTVTSRARRRVGERVLDQHVEHAVEVGARAPHRRPGPARRRTHDPRASAAARQRSTARLGGSRASSICLAEQLAILGAARARAARRRSPRAGRPRPCPPRARARHRAPDADRARLLEAQPQRGQRRAQLMRGVRDELALGRHRRSTRSAISLKDVLSERCSELPSTTRARRQVAAGEPLARCPRGVRSGSAICRAIRPPASRPSSSTVPATSASLATVDADRVLDGGDALGDPHRADRCAARAARARPSRGCSAAGCGSRAAPGRSGRAAPRRSPGGCVARCRAWRCWRCRRARGPASRRRSRARAPTPRSSARARRAPAVARGAAGRRRSAATTSAWLSACEWTSALTRSRRLSASGTPSETTASTST